MGNKHQMEAIRSKQTEEEEKSEAEGKEMASKKGPKQEMSKSNKKCKHCGK